MSADKVFPPMFVDFTLAAQSLEEARSIAETLREYLVRYGKIIEYPLIEYYKFPETYKGQFGITPAGSPDLVLAEIISDLGLDDEATFSSRLMGTLKKFPRVNWLVVSVD